LAVDLSNYASVKCVDWQKKRIDLIEDFLRHQFYGLLRRRIKDFAEKHDGFAEGDLKDNIAFRMDDGKINYLDWRLLYETVLYLKKQKLLIAEHRGKGKPVIYRFTKEA